MSIKYAVSALAIAAGVASPASALTITSISGIWTSADVEAGTIVGSDNAADNVGTSAITWGDVPGDMVLSGYSFAGSATPLETAVDEMFEIGTFTHSNNPIWTDGEMLKGAELALSFTIEGLDDAFTSVFNFAHWETPNEPGSICANGEARTSDVNANGCADRVTLSLNESKSESFTIDHKTYQLDITGFLYQDDLLSSFWTKESAENSAVLQASYTLVSDNTPPEVPLPASGLLLVGGLAALVAKKRKA